GEVADVLADAGGADRLVEHDGGAVGRRQDAEQDLDQGRLAGAVLAEQPEDLALLDTERDALERLDGAEGLDKVVSLDGDLPAPSGGPHAGRGLAGLHLFLHGSPLGTFVARSASEAEKTSLALRANRRTPRSRFGLTAG